MEAVLGECGSGRRMMPVEGGSLFDGATAADLASPLKTNCWRCSRKRLVLRDGPCDATACAVMRVKMRRRANFTSVPSGAGASGKFSKGPMRVGVLSERNAGYRDFAL